jgi:hypothetical protein
MGILSWLRQWIILSKGDLVDWRLESVVRLIQRQVLLLWFIKRLVVGAPHGASPHWCCAPQSQHMIVTVVSYTNLFFDKPHYLVFLNLIQGILLPSAPQFDTRYTIPPQFDTRYTILPSAPQFDTWYTI